ncbi:MAG TPA: terminase [Acidobacteriaceae bacterium]|jgi:hypothetical protein|nr:terminase [Acidobacteriaceae bacterium]
MEMGRRMDRRPSFSIELATQLLRVRGRDGRLQPLRANAVQRAFEQRRGRQNVVLKARQMGMTTWVAARFFLRTITQPGTLTLQVAHTREAAENIFVAVRRMWEGLPRDLREGPLRLSRANAGQMVFAAMDSEFRICGAAEANAGRGLSVQNLHCSEVSRWPGDARETLAGLRAALAPGGEMVLESTPNGAYGAFYEEWCSAGEWSEPTLACDEAAREDGAPSVSAVPEDRMVRHFFPWWMESAYVGPAVAIEAMSAEECALVAQHGLSAAQIGFRRGLERTYGVLRGQEFAEDAESCFRATGACCFDVEAVERRMREAPEAVERRRGGALLLWLKPVAAREYVVAVDSAGGGEDGDFAAVEVVEMETGLQCAELRERLRPAELARVSVELAREYGGAMIAVERNNHGAAVLAYLETSERYGRLYRQQGEAGWLTTAASKPEMIARMGVLLSESAERFMSRRLLAECRTFVADERGRTAAAAGAHDDLVMAMAIAQAVRAEPIAWSGRAFGAKPPHYADVRR